MKLKKNIILSMALLFFLAGNVPGQGQWEWLNPKPQGNTLWDIACIPGTEKIVAVGQEGTVMISEDLGDSWEIQYNAGGTPYFFYSVAFLNEQTGFAAGNTIIKTTDGGKTWATVNLETQNVAFRRITFLDASTGFAVGRGSFFKTTDGGDSWQSVMDAAYHSYFILLLPSDSTGYVMGSEGCCLYGCYEKTTDRGESWTSFTPGASITPNAAWFFDVNHGFIIGRKRDGTYVTSKTADGGETWTVENATNPFVKYFNRLYFLDNQTGFASAGNYGLFKTTDGGETWTHTCDLTHCYSVVAADANHVYGAGRDGSLVKTENGGDSWQSIYSNIFENVYSSPRSLSTVYFPDANTGFAAGSQGLFIKTTDGGQTWSSIDINGEHIQKIYFNDLQNGFAIGTNGLFVTQNGGDTWMCQYDGISTFLFGMHFPLNTHGFLVGRHGHIYKTADAGETWNQLNSTVSDELRTIFFPDTSTGYAASFNGVLLKTTDSGVTWTRLGQDYFHDYDMIESLYFIDSQTGYMSGYLHLKSCILKTTDGGQTWAISGDGISGDLFFTSPDTGYTSTLYQTTNAGETWTKMQPGIPGGVAIHFPDQHTGFAVGGSGAILKYTDTSSPVRPLPDRPKMPVRTALYPNFPNPFNHTTVLTFDLPENARVSLVIYTVTGQEVARVVDGPLPAGKHRLKFNAQDLPSGLYLARLQTGKQVHTRRILLLK